jgi:hypothetical protein
LSTSGNALSPPKSTYASSTSTTRSGQQLLDARERQPDAGGRIGIGDDQARAAAAGPGHHGIDIDAEAFVHGQQFAVDAVQLRIDPIEAVAHVGHQQRLGLLKEGEERVCQHFVRSIAHKNLIGPQAVPPRNCFAQRKGRGIGVALQAACGRLLDRIDSHRRRRIRVLVGVELDEVFDARLLAGHIGFERADARTPEGRYCSGHDGSGAQPSRRARVSKASSTIHITTERQTKPTTLRK